MLSSQLVPGDIIQIRAGDRVPADLILFSAQDLKVDNSSLTGESEPQTRIPCRGAAKSNLTKQTSFAATKKVEPVDESNPIESKSLVFAGTRVTSGSGYGIVLRTGNNTYFGKIANLSAGEKSRKSPLSAEIRRFCKLITFMAGCTAFVLFIVAWARSQHFNYSLQFSIGILLAWVPQGLPITVTMLLAISGRRMNNLNVLVKDIHGVETLGAITMLCTDKTGTITQNTFILIFCVH